MIHEDDVGTRCRRAANGLLTVLEAVDDFHIRLRLYDEAQAFGNNAVIIDDEYLDRHVTSEPGP